MSNGYRGIWASTYDVLAPGDEVGDREFFRQAILDGGQPALEIASGTGRLLLSYVEEGLDVEGLELSPEMLSLCHRKAAERGIAVTLHQQDMRSFDLARRYRCIYVPFCTIMLLIDIDDVRRTLDCFLEHLEASGTAIVPLFLPWKADVGREPIPAGEWCLRREGRRPEDGAMIRCWERTRYDFENQLKESLIRFEVIPDSGDTKVAQAEGEMTGGEGEEYDSSIRWHTQEQFASIMEAAGFADVRALHGHTWKPAQAEDASFTLVGTKN